MSERLIKLVRDFAAAAPHIENPITLEITLETTLAELGYDSFDAIELVMCIEDELKIQIGDEEVEDVTKIGDFLRAPTIAKALGHGG